MTAFILSSAIAFAFYELLAFTRWPPAETRFHFYRATLVLTPAAASTARKVVRIFLVISLLLFVLTVHNVAWPFESFTRYEVNIVFGFVFGPLFAIWVNSIVIHSANKDLSRNQILAAIALVVLFFLGATGDETSKLLGRYARNLSSVKLAGAELAFTPKERGDRDRLSSTPISGTSGAYVTGGSQGLQYLAALDGIIKRDHDYLTKAFAPRDPHLPIWDIDSSRSFAMESITPPVGCLLAWFGQTGDSRPVDRYLTAYADRFRQLEALNTQMAATAGPLNADEQTSVRELVSNFVHGGLTMALDIALSTTDKNVLTACEPWFNAYCPEDSPKPPGGGPMLSAARLSCLRASLAQFAGPPEQQKTGKVDERIKSLTDGLAQFIKPQSSYDRRGLETLPYFAIARASLMAQLGQYEAAAAILDDWLRLRRDAMARPEMQAAFAERPALAIKDSWFALRVRSMLVAYVEEWLEDEETRAATVVETEHLKNLQATRDGFKSRLLKADFFRDLDKACGTKCEPAFRHPAECHSDEPTERLVLWRQLYSSYLTMEYTYIHRAIQHPDYQRKFAETVNDEARRLVNFDLSCGADQPKPEVVYGQSLLGFAENAVAYFQVRAGIDGAETLTRRLDEAERAVKLGLEIVEQPATEDQERGDKRYLERIAPSVAVQVQENLRRQLKEIAQARKQLE
jgi:hypothetical protein